MLLEAPRHDLLQHPRHARRQRRCLVVKDRVQRVDGAFAAERLAPCQGLVEDDPEREDVGPVIDLAPVYLLGGHVADGAQRHARCRVRESGLTLSNVRRDNLCEPEIEDLRRPGVRDQNVVGFQVAMDDALRVRGVESARDLPRQCEHRVGRHGRPRQTAPEGLTLKQLRHEVWLLAVEDGVEDGDDVRMVQAARRARLALEALHTVRVAREFRRQQLDGHDAVEHVVTRRVDDPHPPGPQAIENLVPAYATAARQLHDGRCRLSPDSVRPICCLAQPDWMLAPLGPNSPSTAWSERCGGVLHSPH